MQDNAGLSYKKLRQTVGWLGILLPLIVYLHTVLFGECERLQDSISHYYYTVANSWFVGILWGMALVLFFYPTPTGKPGKDGVLTTVAGFCALGVSLFPTSADSNDSCAVFKMGDSPWITGIHYLSAATMLCIFSYISIAIFTKTAPGNDLKSAENKWKRVRNRIYIIAGCLTLISVALIGIFTLIGIAWPQQPMPTKYTFWLEVTALIPFGFAWLIKGGFAFTDDGETSTLGKVKNFVQGKKA